MSHAGQPHLCTTVVLGLLMLSRAGPTSQSRNLAPYVPTPADVVERMLQVAKVGPRDVVYDLGCGDGRIVIAAAQKFGARGVGIDIDANLINQAEANAKAAGVERRVKFLVQDAMTADVSERVLVTAHTHVQFDRVVAGVRSINAGSVGMPYEGRGGAFWAILGAEVDLRTTEYSLEFAAERYRASGDPLAEQMVDLLFTPPTREEVIEHAERLEFSG